MENENQKLKLSLADIFRVQHEICNSTNNCFSQCPFAINGDCIMSDVGNMRTYADEIEAICIEWETNKPTVAEKIDEILKPYGMKLRDGNHYIWFDDENMETHTKDELINKLYTTKWKGHTNE